MISRPQLLSVSPGAGDFHDGIMQVQSRFQIATPLRLAHFLAQCSHESAGFTALVENVNYSASVLCKVWPSRFRMPGPGDDASEPQFVDGKANALRYERQPQRIANRVYAGRMGNGNETSGDGWTFRGRGAIQLTGAEQFRLYSIAIYGDERCVEQPDRLSRDPDAILSAGWYWQRNGLNKWADTDDCGAISGIVNTGKPTGKAHGMADRLHWLARWRKVLKC